MLRESVVVLVPSLVLAWVPSLTSEERNNLDQAITLIKSLGGKAVTQGGLADRSVVEVDLGGTGVTDRHLGELTALLPAARPMNRLCGRCL